MSRNAEPQMSAPQLKPSVAMVWFVYACAERESGEICDEINHDATSYSSNMK